MNEAMRREVVFCNLETTKVLKFPKEFGYFIEM